MLTEIIKNLGAVAGSITSIIAFITFLIKPVRNKLICYIKKELGYNETNESIKKLNNEVKVLYDKIRSTDVKLEGYIQLQKKRNDLNDEAQLYNLRQHINEVYIRYMQLGKIPVEVRENLVKGYNVYKKLGGNSYIERVVEELLELPVDV